MALKAFRAAAGLGCDDLRAAFNCQTAETEAMGLARTAKYFERLTRGAEFRSQYLIVKGEAHVP